jgi:hypothetical protein
LGQQPAFEETCERYLLGELSEAEREQFEEDYFIDDRLFDRFLAIKDELLDLYARGELADEKRRRFAEHFLATAPRRGRLDETQEFIRAATVTSTKSVTTDGATINAPLASPTSKLLWQSFKDFFNFRSFAWQLTLAAVIVVALLGVWVFVRNWQQQVRRDEFAGTQPTPTPTIAFTSSLPTNNSDDNTNANDNTAMTPSLPHANANKPPANVNSAPQTTPKKPAPSPPQISPAQIASVLLLPVASRDINNANILQLNPETRMARLSLVFKDNDYRNYKVEVSTVAGATVWEQKSLKANTSGGNKSVMLQFMPTILQQQDYIVTLKGQTAAGKTETIGEYYFRVQRAPSENMTKPTP